MRSIIFTLIILFNVSVYAQNQTPEKTQFIRVAIYQNPPRLFINEDNKPDGFWPAIINQIAQKEGWDIQWVNVTWDEGLKKLDQAKIDILPDMGWTQKRASQYLLSKQEVILSWSRIYVTIDSDVQNIVDLNGKTIAGLRGSINLHGPEGILVMVNSFDLDMNVIEMDTYQQVIAALENKTIDAGVTNKDIGNFFEKSYNIKRSPIILQPTHLHFSYPKTARGFNLREIIDNDIFELKNDKSSIFYRANDQFINSKEPTSIKEVIPSWLITLTEIVALITVFITILLFLTRVQVKKKTVELQTSEKKFRTLIDSSPVGMILLDKKGSVIYLNQRATEITGLSSQIKNNIRWLENVHKKDTVFINQKFNEAIGKQNSFEYEIRWEHGHSKTVWSHVKIIPVAMPAPDTKIFIGTLVDITERRLAEADNSKLSAAIEQSTVMVMITNIKGEIEYVNKAFIDVTGFTKKETYGKTPAFLHSGNTSRETYKDLWEHLESEKDWDGEFVNVKKNGEQFHERNHISTLKDYEGFVTHYVAIKEDITEERLIALELEEHRYHLEKLVENRTEELVIARSKAEEASLAKSKFLANMSHEIRTPMNAILGLTHILKRLNPSQIQQDKLNKIDLSSKHLLSVINDILDIAKIESDKFTLESNDFHLDAIFDHVVSIVTEQVKMKGLTTLIDKNAVPLWLIGDSTRIKQALLNLVANAVKFTDEGIIYIRSKKLKSTRERILVRFEVEDMGSGIETDKIEALFDPFEQEDSSTTRKYGGTGLGLGITRHLAQMMGGEAGAESEIGKGSIFWFTAWLEISKNLEGTPKHSKLLNVEQELSKLKNIKVLLVEDNDINREVAVDLLLSVNIKVDIAINGKEAVQKAQHHKYNLILMDVQMPEMDGMEATRIIRKNFDANQLPILAMTANIFLEDRLDCLNVGMNDFVAKPVDPTLLFQTILKWLPSNSKETYLSDDNIKIKKEKMPQNIQIKKTSSFEQIRGLDLKIASKNFAGNTQKLSRLLSKLKNQIGKDMKSFDAYLKTRKPEISLRKLHAIKGSSGTIGMIKIAEISAELETQIKADNTVKSRSLITKLKKTLDQFETDLELFAKANSDSNHEKKSHVEMKNILNEILYAVSNDSPEANELFYQNEVQLKQIYGQEMEKLAEQLDEFSYSEAFRTLTDFIKNMQ